MNEHEGGYDSDTSCWRRLLLDLDLDDLDLLVDEKEEQRRGAAAAGGAG